jgi:hypothetical protein
VRGKAHWQLRKTARGRTRATATPATASAMFFTGDIGVGR